MVCPNCGRHLKTIGRFCPMCGAPIEASDKNKRKKMVMYIVSGILFLLSVLLLIGILILSYAESDTIERILTIFVE